MPPPKKGAKIRTATTNTLPVFVRSASSTCHASTPLDFNSQTPQRASLRILGVKVQLLRRAPSPSDSEASLASSSSSSHRARTSLFRPILERLTNMQIQPPSRLLQPRRPLRDGPAPFVRKSMCALRGLAGATVKASPPPALQARVQGRRPRRRRPRGRQGGERALLAAARAGRGRTGGRGRAGATPRPPRRLRPLPSAAATAATTAAAAPPPASGRAFASRAAALARR